MYSFINRDEPAVELRGQKYRLNLAFNRVIQAYTILYEDDVDEEDKIDQIYDLLMLDKPGNETDEFKYLVFQGVFDYLNSSPYHMPIQTDISGKQVNSKPPLPDFDFEQDAAAIYASFMQYYSINLNEYVEKMQWDEFKALFDNLGPDTPINRIRGYRNANLSDYSDNPEALAQMSELQDYYKLDIVRKHEEEAEKDPVNTAMGDIFGSMFPTIPKKGG